MDIKTNLEYGLRVESGMRCTNTAHSDDVRMEILGSDIDPVFLGESEADGDMVAWTFVVQDGRPLVIAQRHEIAELNTNQTQWLRAAWTAHELPAGCDVSALVGATGA